MLGRECLVFLWVVAACWPVVAGCSAKPAPASRAGFGATAAGGPATAAVPAVAAKVAPPTTQPAAARADAPAFVEPWLLPTPAAAAADPFALERHWREQLATAADPTDAALALAGWLCELERHDEADLVLAAAQARVPGPELRIARAGVWRDLGQRHRAAAELGAVIVEHGAAEVHPGLLLELAELHLLEGSPDAARAALQQLRSVHAGAPWVVQRQLPIEALALAIEQPGGPRRITVRDLLGNLRGAPVPTARLAALEALANEAPVPAGSVQPLHEQAIAIALGDPSPAVRARALEMAQLSPSVMHELVLAALEDPAALVRSIAADRVTAALGHADLPQLHTLLAAESDAGAFARLHAALRGLEPTRPALAPGAADTVAGRAAAAAWGRP
jgi:hypothetical protein